MPKEDDSMTSNMLADVALIAAFAFIAWWAERMFYRYNLIHRAVYGYGVPDEQRDEVLDLMGRYQVPRLRLIVMRWVYRLIAICSAIITLAFILKAALP